MKLDRAVGAKTHAQRPWRPRETDTLCVKNHIAWLGWSMSLADTYRESLLGFHFTRLEYSKLGCGMLFEIRAHHENLSQ
ncbi:hypothetical protein KDI_54320 [Dictyobacter arantiisoli]|uniref:Uncharacterized protein n=1 Tax=Dictyobacter arantiisoli TaxID=2014874 RepID=A0A5A5TKV5_9CHLR|nr:hypothetical protein KDI_54320 [Dictyobacter arantiisoli]